MLKKIALAIVLVVGAGAPALAQSVCSKPIPPAPINGATATKPQIVAASHDANLFIKASDDYQQCIQTEYNGKVDAAKADKTDIDPAITDAARTEVTDSQTMKMRVGSEFQASYAAYKKAHPGG